MKLLLMHIVKFFLAHLVAIHKGTVVAKLKASFFLALSFSPVAFIVDKMTNWYMANYGYVAFVLVAILFDHLLGSWVHAFIKRDFAKKKNIQGLLVKCAMVLMVGVLVEGFNHLLGKSIVTDYFGLMSRLMVFVYPAGSALMNCAIITDGAFPPTSWLSKITKFNKNLDLKYFKNEKEDKN